jgi:hypothetical protein
MVAHAAGAGGLLACLSEQEPLLQVHALRRPAVSSCCAFVA